MCKLVVRRERLEPSNDLALSERLVLRATPPLSLARLPPLLSLPPCVLSSCRWNRLRVPLPLLGMKIVIVVMMPSLPLRLLQGMPLWGPLLLPRVLPWLLLLLLLMRKRKRYRRRWRLLPLLLMSLIWPLVQALLKLMLMLQVRLVLMLMLMQLRQLLQVLLLTRLSLLRKLLLKLRLEWLQQSLTLRVRCRFLHVLAPLRVSVPLPRLLRPILMARPTTLCFSLLKSALPLAASTALWPLPLGSLLLGTCRRRLSLTGPHIEHISPWRLACKHEIPIILSVESWAGRRRGC